MRVILCFGDSLTFGEKDYEIGGWVERLKKHYLNEERPLPYQNTFVYNLGIASETSDGLVARIESEIKARKIGKHSLDVVLFYGLNDIRIHKSKNIVPLEFFRRNMSNALDTISSLRGRALLINLPLLDTDIDGVEDIQGNLRFSKDIERYNELLREISDINGLTLIDFCSDASKSREIYASDKLHLNEKGHKLLFESVLKAICLTESFKSRPS